MEERYLKGRNESLEWEPEVENSIVRQGQTQDLVF